MTIKDKKPGPLNNKATDKLQLKSQLVISFQMPGHLYI